ncbi:hypothetical protein B0H17DRAFT_1144973 [Mycena rosella]|uniref:Uncharacterized protein n=1 Tax=Mycena rosella TaxID=1033263 RepID=A0AAD7CS07_MYCRO|nr:hypothetical protein B0H17DRAFT_1144973 [Mycena rosella]
MGLETLDLLPAAQNEVETPELIEEEITDIEAWLHMACSSYKAMDFSRRLALHPSALSDAENTFFTASLADLRTPPAIWSMSASACVSRMRGSEDDPAPVQPGDDAQQQRLLLLVLHAQAERGIDRGLAFVQVASCYYYYLIALSAVSAVPAAPIPAKRSHEPLPPHARPLPRSARPPAAAPAQADLLGTAQSGATSASPPRRRASPHPREGHSTHTPPHSPVPAPPFTCTRSSPRRRTPCAAPRRSAPPPRRPHTSSTPPTALKITHMHNQKNPFRPTPPPRTSGAYTSSASAGLRTISFALVHAPHPPVHPQRRVSAFEAAYGAPPPAPPSMYAAHDGWRAASDSAPLRRPSGSSSYTSKLTCSPARERTASTSVLLLTLPKGLRRTLAGTGWVGAERGGDGVRGGGGGGGGYTMRNGRRGRKRGRGQGQGQGQGMGGAL